MADQNHLFALVNCFWKSYLPLKNINILKEYIICAYIIHFIEKLHLNFIKIDNLFLKSV
jgi:hypothetical protein